MNWIVEQLKFPCAICLIVLFIILIELYQKGWKESALKRILKHDESTFKDIIWFILSITGLIRLCALVITLGVSIWFTIIIHWKSPICSWPFVCQLLFAGFTNEFMFYWTHRMLHKWLWFAHKIHHQPTSFNGITVFRTHPIEVALQSSFLMLPCALIGISSSVILSFSLFRMFHDILIHSNIDWCPAWMSKWIIVDGKQHSHHHSSKPEDYDCKFGLFPIFDRMFGTWKDLPSDRIIKLGCD
jgi:sterol desaturase/sphingolipid hydroxylase (fatty acid hydroxylase superfamily)